MSYVAENLLNGETLAYRTRLHWKLFIAPALIAVVLLPVAYFAAQSREKIWAVLPLVLIVIAFVPAYLKRMTSEFAVTNKRVIMKVGVFSTRSFELLLNKVEGIAVNQKLLGRLLDYGDIVVTGSGGDKELFSDIQGPLQFRHAIQAVTTEAQDRTGANRTANV